MDEKIVLEEPANEVKIKDTDVHWTEYVLSQLHESEIVEGRPRTIGLRRFFESYYGRITEQRTHIYQSPNPQNQNRAVVKVELVYCDNDRNRIVFSGVSDCFAGNTQLPYSNYPTATAETMAEGRALRRYMKLDTITVEESTPPSNEEIKVNQDISNDMLQISDTQKNAINNLCNRLAIDLNKLLKYAVIETNNKEDLSMLNYNEASKLMRLLNDFNRGVPNGGKMIPEVVLK